MSINRREDILARLFAICAAQDGVESTFRNRGNMENDKFPAIGLLDGDEQATSQSQRQGSRAVPVNAQGMTTVLITMRPQIFIMLKNTKPLNNTTGQNLNTFRGALIRAIANDAQLIALIGPNGSLAYESAETDLKTGMSMEGQMQINLAITAPLNPYT